MNLITGLAAELSQPFTHFFVDDFGELGCIQRGAGEGSWEGVAEGAFVCSVEGSCVLTLGSSGRAVEGAGNVLAGYVTNGCGFINEGDSAT